MIKAGYSILAKTKGAGRRVMDMTPGSRREAVQKGRATAAQVRTTETTGRIGAGLSSMKRHKVRTGMVVGAGMGVAAAMRNTGSGSASSRQSLYRH